MNPHSYIHLTFDKVTKNVQPLQQMSWENWVSACRKLKLDPCLSPCTSINSKWIEDLNIRPETLKLVQVRAGNTLELIGIGNDFLNRTPRLSNKRWTNRTT
jgi:hypothetical protein